MNYKLDRIEFAVEFQIQLKEVVLDEQDVAKALLDYISTNYINNIVVGASTRNALTRFHFSLSIKISTFFEK